VEDGQVAAAGRRVGERQHVVHQVVVDRQGEQIRLVPHGPQQAAHTSRRVADGVALVGRRHPLVDDHRAVSSSGRAWNAAGRVERTSSSHSA
jgi:hypothetical protein